VRLGLVVALPEEARAVSRAIRVEQRGHFAASGEERPAVRFLSGRMGDLTVEIAWAGAGPACAARATRILLAAGADSLLAVGFAGALAPGVRPGALLLATQVVDEKGARWPADASFREALANAGAAPAAAGSSVPSSVAASGFHQGVLVTVPRVVTTAAEKRRLGEETGALAVDMESAAVARTAAEARVPMAALRVITDDVDEQLPLDFNRCLDSAGQFQYGRLMLLLARRPLAVSGLVRLGRHSARAGQALASFLAVSLPLLVPSSS
jgi:adenosylhomocysteine nucleosidase